MSQCNTQFLELYQQYRYRDQLEYYEGRKEEFESARREAFLLTVCFMFLAAIAAILTPVLVSLDIIGWATLCAALAVIFPMFASAITAYDTLYAFERHKKLYEDVIIALHRAQAEKPDLMPGLGEVDYFKALSYYIDGVERILRTEQGQWAQLVNDIQLIDPPLPQT